MVYFISPEDLKDFSQIDGNVDEKLLYQSILYIQEVNVKPIVGSALYSEIETQITANTLTALNNTLLSDYIQPAMRFWVMGEVVRPLTMRITNIGVVQNASPNSQTLTSQDLTTLEEHYRNRAEILAQRAVDYLCAHTNDYPLYLNAGEDSDTIHPVKNQFTSPLYGTTKKVNRF